MVTFTIKDHTIRAGIQVVELRDEKGRLIGAIMPGDGRDIRVYSKYLHSEREIGRGIVQIAFSATVTVPELDGSRLISWQM